MNLLRAFLFLTLFATPAAAMDNTATPAKFPLYWANNASASFVRNIPVNSQIGISNGAASLADGFPPLTFQPIASGGIPPDGRDFNGILRQVTQALRWAQAGGMYTFDSSFASSVGGYPKNAMLQSKVLNGRVWMSVVDNNTTDPDGPVNSNWVAQPGTRSAGEPIPWFSSVSSPANAVLADGRTIGNASSSATLAGAQTYWLFSFLWTNCSWCQLYNSTGSPIIRGSSFDADWNNNDRIAVLPMQGLGLIGADKGTSYFNGVPVSQGNTGSPASLVGENLHTETVAEMPQHYHSAAIFDPGHSHGVTISGGNTVIVNASSGSGTGGGGSFSPPGGISINTSLTGVRVNSSNGLDTTYSAGGGAAANNVSRNLLVYWFLSL